MLAFGRIGCCLVAACAVGMAIAAPNGADPGADLVVVGEIRTSTGSAARAGGLAVRGQKIVTIGTAVEARKQLRRGGRLIRLRPGQIVMPGLIDSHVHMLDAGVMNLQCAVGEPKTKQAMLATIKAYAVAHPALPWVIGSGWPPHLFDASGPRKSDLDAVIPDRPAVFYGQDGHSLWLNSAALRAAGITRETQDPPGGRIVRDGSGDPSGTLLESAMDLAEAKVPKPSRAMSLEGLRAAQRLLHSLGITMIQDANVDPRNLEVYEAAARSGLLTMKVVAAQATDPSRPASQVDELVRLRDRCASHRLTAGTAKIFLDGVLESRTAALLEPYAGAGKERGILRWDAKALSELAIRLDRAGFQMHMHALGDQAVRAGLDAIAAARAANGPSDNRHEIAHLQVMNPADFGRFATLGAVANFQPYWMFADEWSRKNMVAFIGADRARHIYPLGSVARAGARVAVGSDWPVSSPNPFLAMQVGVTRQAPEPPRLAPYLPGERVTLQTLLTAYTTGGAYANHRERETGSLEVGKAADFIVLDRDLFRAQPLEIGKTRVLNTFVDGKEVYRVKG